MDELVGRLAAKAGIDSAVAEKIVGIILDFLRKEGPSDKVQALIDRIPGAEAAIEASSNSGGLGRLMGGGLMALGTRLMSTFVGGTYRSDRSRPDTPVLPSLGGTMTGFNRLARCSMMTAEAPGVREEAMRWLCPTTRWPIPTRKFSSGRASSRPG